jgi:type IV secretory pathway ATPase VirB11/archaellum biosynthesis ATPase
MTNLWVTAKPISRSESMLDAFDRFVAAAMSGHDMLYKLARERMVNEQRPDS